MSDDGLPEARRTRRLFFALWPDPVTRRALQRETRAAVRAAGGQPVPAPNYHITLAFLGGVPAAQFDAVVNAAHGVPMPGLDLALDRYGHYPRSRTFWIGPARPPRRLAHFVNSLWDAVESTGLPRELRAYHPHLTLCRKCGAMRELPQPNPVHWRVYDYVLVESTTDPGGAQYRVVAQFPTGSPADPGRA